MEKKKLQECKDEIEEILHDLNVDIQSCEYIGINEPEITTTRECAYELEKAIEKLYSCQSVPLNDGWKDASILPETNGKYLVKVEIDGIITANYSTEYGTQYHWNVPSGRVTHWMNLPKPPKP